MRFSLLAAGAALLLCQSAAMAQTHSLANEPNAAQSTNATEANNPQTAAQGSLRGEVRDMLEKAGFSHVQMMASSFVVHADDRRGNPVAMTISPDAFDIAKASGSPGSDHAAGAPEANNAKTAAQGSLRAEMGDMLQKAGFSHVHVLASSFVVHADDRSGNRVAMTVSPKAFDIADVSGSPGSDRGAGAAEANNARTVQDSRRAEVRDMLQKAGFSDIHVMASSFVVNAKDHSGNPVAMTINPDAF